MDGWALILRKSVLTRAGANTPLRVWTYPHQHTQKFFLRILDTSLIIINIIMYTCN